MIFKTNPLIAIKKTIARQRLLLLLLILTATSFNSCFWKYYSFSGANIPPGVETFSVDLFANEATLVNPQLSINFTEKIKTKFQTQTKLGLVAQQGDYQISGSIIDYRIDPATLNADVGTAQNQFSIKVKVEFACPKYPEKNTAKEYSFFKIYDANQPFESVESPLSEEITDNIVQQIFAAIALDW